MSQILQFDRDEVEDEEEALSLCDLPVTSTITQEEAGKGDVDIPKGNDSDFDFDFDFGSLVGSITALESEMCAADEVFSGGRILPFRHSVSSEVGLSRLRAPIRSISRSGSMGRVGLGSSSRSSSTRSQQSAGSSSTSSGSSSPKKKVKAGNHFHSYPSPKPQIRGSGAARPINSCGGTTKTTMWQVLRLGLLRTPEMELQDLKVRRRTSSSHNNNLHNNSPMNRSSRSDSVSSSSSSSDSTKKHRDGNVEKEKRKSNKNRGGIMGSCKCSVGAIEPIIMAPRIRGRGSDQNRKLVLLLNEDKEEDGRREAEMGRQGRRVASHHRTFEWLIRDISQTSVLNSFLV